MELTVAFMALGSGFVFWLRDAGLLGGGCIACVCIWGRNSCRCWTICGPFRGVVFGGEIFDFVSC